MLWMGHSDEKMIRKIYDHISDKRKEEAIKMASERANLQAQLVKTIVIPENNQKNLL